MFVCSTAQARCARFRLALRSLTLDLIVSSLEKKSDGFKLYTCFYSYSDEREIEPAEKLEQTEARLKTDKDTKISILCSLV